ncbi:MAG: diaminopimelate epimerase [Dehalococcoidia bacterium]
MKFTKLHGAGNDFLVIDARDGERDWSRLAVSICERNLGAGADGLLLIEDSSAADLRMVLYNADGSEAETSGNGLRCFVKYAVDHALAQLRDGAITVETLAGVSKAEADVRDGLVQSVRVSMGRPRFEAQEVPIAIEAKAPLKDVALDVEGRRLAVTCVSMGNPHAVEFVSSVDEYELLTIGPKVEHHALFPARVNFSIARVIDRAHIESRTWERGVGETLACGTGASAVMVAARLHHLADARVELTQPGGTLVLEWDGAGEVFLTGPAVEVYTGEWPE